MIYYLVPVCLCLISLCKGDDDKYIVIPFSGPEDINISLYFGESNKVNLTYPLITTQPFSCIPEREYINPSFNTSKKISDTVIQRGGRNFEVKDILFDITMNDKNGIMKSVPLRFYVNDDFMFTDLINRRYGFSYKFDNNEFSIVHQLKSNNIIEHRQFTIVPRFGTINEEGDLYIGKVPDSILHYNNNSLKCQIEDEFPLWGCIINSIKIGNYSLNKEYVLTVKTDLYYSTIPLDMYRYFKESLFNIEFSSKCTKQLDRGHDEYIYCKEEYIKTLNTNIEIIIGDKKFIFLLKNLFDCDDKKSCRSIFVYCSEHIGQFNIGNSLLEQFVTTFDYDNHQIVFYGNSTIDKVDSVSSLSNNESPSNKVILLMLILVSLLLMGSLSFFIIFKKQEV